VSQEKRSLSKPSVSRDAGASLRIIAVARRVGISSSALRARETLGHQTQRLACPLSPYSEADVRLLQRAIFSLRPRIKSRRPPPTPPPSPPPPPPPPPHPPPDRSLLTRRASFHRQPKYRLAHCFSPLASRPALFPSRRFQRHRVSIFSERSLTAR